MSELGVAPHHKQSSGPELGHGFLPDGKALNADLVEAAREWPAADTFLPLQNRRVMIRLLSFTVFVVLQFVFLPLAVGGALLVAYRQMAVSKRLGVSSTAIEVLNGRWTMHVFGMRSDPDTAWLASVLPNTSILGLWLVLLPLWVKYRICGTLFGYPRAPEAGNEVLADLVIARTLCFDRLISRVAGEVEQFVVLGAGYDTRAYGELKETALAVFEVDQTETQVYKIASLHDAGIDTSHVTFVQVDFRQDKLFEKLLASGYDPTKKTLFLWEGVTLYLSEDRVRRILTEVRAHAATGSAIVADVYGERLVRMAKGRFASKVLEYTNEGVGFGLPFDADFEQNLGRFLESEGLRKGETFFMGKTHKAGPFMVVAEFRF